MAKPSQPGMTGKNVKNVMLIIILIAVYGLISVTGIIGSGIYAEYGARGEGGEYLFDVKRGLIISNCIAGISTVITALLFWMKKKNKKAEPAI